MKPERNLLIQFCTPHNSDEAEIWKKLLRLEITE